MKFEIKQVKIKLFEYKKTITFLLLFYLNLDRLIKIFLQGI